MNQLLTLALQNVAGALILAVWVHGLTRVLRNPPLAHVLWVIVLLKLIAPAVMPVERSTLRLLVSTFRAEQSTADLAPPHEANEPVASRFADQPRTDLPPGEVHSAQADAVAEPTTASDPTTILAQPPLAEGGQRPFTLRIVPVLFGCWLAGTVVCALTASTRIVRFERLLRDALPASERLQRLLIEVARTLDVRRLPEVRCVESVVVPLVWWIGRRPTLVVPMRLLHELDDRQVALIVAHELAHLRRRDHWVRVVELIVAVVHWWNPLAWAVRRQIHQAEDLCCDAWVRWAFPECRKRYAEVVLKAAETLCGSPTPAGLAPASSFLRTLSLKARIEMIMESQFKPRLSARSLFVAALLGVLVLPSFFLVAKTEALADANGEAAAASSDKPEAETRSEFSSVVKFERGATKFLDGDEIAVVEVRGTADTFTPGGIYLVKGTYTLRSSDRATLSAYTTARNAADAKSKSFNAQTAAVKKGSGTFTLFLPMACEGWPHVSFYPADGGEGFGGVYFGTGGSVLKRWWGEKESAEPANDGKPAKQSQSSRGPWRAFGRVTESICVAPAAESKTRLTRGQPNENGEFVVTSRSPAKAG